MINWGSNLALDQVLNLRDKSSGQDQELKLTILGSLDEDLDSNSEIDGSSLRDGVRSDSPGRLEESSATSKLQSDLLDADAVLLLDLFLDGKDSVSWSSVHGEEDDILRVGDGNEDTSLDGDDGTISEAVALDSLGVDKQLSASVELLLVLGDGLLLLDLVLDNEHGVFDLDGDIEDQTMFGLDLKFSGAVVDLQNDGGSFSETLLVDGLGSLESDGTEEESLVVDWEAFFGLDHSLELCESVGIVDFDLDSLGSIHLNVDLEASGEHDQRSFSESGLSTRFGILKQDVVESKSLDVLGDGLSSKDLVLDAGDGILVVDSKLDGLNGRLYH